MGLVSEEACIRWYSKCILTFTSYLSDQQKASLTSWQLNRYTTFITAWGTWPLQTVVTDKCYPGYSSAFNLWPFQAMSINQDNMPDILWLGRTYNTLPGFYKCQHLCLIFQSQFNVAGLSSFVLLMVWKIKRVEKGGELFCKGQCWPQLNSKGKLLLLSGFYAVREERSVLGNTVWHV